MIGDPRHHTLVSGGESALRRESRRRSLRSAARVPLVAALALVAATPAAVAEDGGWLTRKHGTGGWDGLRQKWLAEGVVPGGYYVFDVLGNPAGGADQATAYTGRAEFDLSLNLNRLLGAKGLAFDLAFSWSSGSNLSDDIGNVFQVGEAYSGQTVQLSRLFFEQTLADGRLFLKLGRVSAGNDFASLPAGVYYVNAAVNGNPLSIAVNEPGFFTDPVAQWGLRVLYHPTDHLHFRLAAYNPDPSVGDEGNHGFDFGFNPANGVLAMAEIGWTPSFEVNGGEYRGVYKTGAYVDTGEFAFVDDPALSRDGQWGLYIMAQQEVFHEDEDPTELEFRPFFGRHLIRTETPINVASSHQGLTPWCVLALSPRQEISAIPFYVAGGLLYRGLFKGRSNDHTGLAVYHGRFSDSLPDQGSETVLELNHGFQATPWFYLTPDIQYVIQPGGSDAIPDAFVVGFEVGITF